MRSNESYEPLIEVLARWEGSQVMVRVVATAADDLIVVFSGPLQARSDEKHPSLFWPVGPPGDLGPERPGIYLHPESFERARIREGDFVAEFSQAGVTVNVRRRSAIALDREEVPVGVREPGDFAAAGAG